MILEILVPVAVIVLVVYLFRPRPAFTVRIRNGRATTARGKVYPGFLSDCEAICADCDLHRGAIRGIADGEVIRLRFSAGIPTAHHQRFRNSFNIHR